MAVSITGESGTISGFVGKWTAYSAFGSFLLYLVGYLTLRFQLSTYGVATNLDLLDERYLFAGCRFLVFAVTSVPSILMVALLLAAIGFLPYRLIPVDVRRNIRGRVTAWCLQTERLSVTGIILSVLAIQLVMRKCFAFGNVLLARQLPPGWISSVLLASPGWLALYFSGLVALTMITGGILLTAWLRPESRKTVAAGLLLFLFTVQALLLPVNYGVLISTQQLPRLGQVEGDKHPREAAIYWLVSDSKDEATYLVRDAGDHRSLLTLPKKEYKAEIVAYDDIFCVLFSRNHDPFRPCS